jgi:TRAP-type C4-dicarboxylate transport system permease small subunit
VYCGMVEYVIRMMWGIPHTTIPYNAISYGMVYDIILIGMVLYVLLVVLRAEQR